MDLRKKRAEQALKALQNKGPGMRWRGETSRRLSAMNQFKRKVATQSFSKRGKTLVKNAPFAGGPASEDYVDWDLPVVVAELAHYAVGDGSGPKVRSEASTKLLGGLLLLGPEQVYFGLTQSGLQGTTLLRETRKLERKMAQRILSAELVDTYAGLRALRQKAPNVWRMGDVFTMRAGFHVLMIADQILADPSALDSLDGEDTQVLNREPSQEIYKQYCERLWAKKEPLMDDGSPYALPFFG